MDRPSEEANPELQLDEAKAMAVYGMMHLLVDEIQDSEFRYAGDSGHVIGKLKKDLGPLKAGTSVVLENIGERVKLHLWKETEQLDDDGEPIFESILVHQFRIAVPEPIIIEDKIRVP